MCKYFTKFEAITSQMEDASMCIVYWAVSSCWLTVERDSDETIFEKEKENEKEK